MGLRRRPGVLFFVVGATCLSLASFLRRNVIPTIENEFVILSTVAFVLAVAVSYVLYIPGEPGTPGPDELEFTEE